MLETPLAIQSRKSSHGSTKGVVSDTDSDSRECQWHWSMICWCRAHPMLQGHPAWLRNAIPQNWAGFSRAFIAWHASQSWTARLCEVDLVCSMLTVGSPPPSRLVCLQNERATRLLPPCWRSELRVHTGSGAGSISHGPNAGAHASIGSGPFILCMSTPTGRWARLCRCAERGPWMVMLSYLWSEPRQCGPPLLQPLRSSGREASALCDWRSAPRLWNQFWC